MRLETALVGEREHLVVYPCRITYPEYLDASVYQLFGNPIDSHIALRADQNLVFAVQCLIDGLDKRGRLSRAWRAMNDGDIFRSQDLIDRHLLRMV